MAKAHFITPTGPIEDAITVRLGAGSGTSNNFDEKEVGKPVKLVAESRYDLAAAGNEIEGYITSVELATSAGFSIGGIQHALGTGMAMYRMAERAMDDGNDNGM